MANGPSGSRSFSNQILARLSPEELGRLEPKLKAIEFEVRQPIYQPGTTIRHAYFVETGMISMVSLMEDGRSIEVGTVGKEGLAGGFLLLGVASVPYQYYVQIAGSGFRLEAPVLKEETDRGGNLRDMILRYQAVFQTQSLQTAACNGLHSIQQRCCRWLLMSQDKVESEIVPLTHEFLALMLGVRRASVTDVLRPLQDRGWIQSKRGAFTILDRKGLESGSCECHRVISEQQRELLK